jgi:hypothetical protein
MLNDVVDVQYLKYGPKTFQDHIRSIKSFSTPFEILLTAILPSGVRQELDYVKMHSTFSSDIKQAFEGWCARHGLAQGLTIKRVR